MNDVYFNHFLNCINCGGVLQNGVCPYCGTDYNTAKKLSINFEKSQHFAEIKIGNKKHDVYLASEDIELFQSEAFRDANGKLNKSKAGIVRKWTFIQINPDYLD